MPILWKNAKIIDRECLSPGVFDLWLYAPEMAKDALPGQFISIYLKDPSKRLPRPISICETDREKGLLRLVYRVTGKGRGTEEISGHLPGECIRVMGPLGNGFPLDAGREETVLIGGGIGIPPLLALMKALPKGTKAVLGYRNRDTFLRKDFEELGEVYIATEDGSVGTKGTVLDAIRENSIGGKVWMACGPTPMLRAIKDEAQKKRRECYLSLEERMACGIGACLACVCKSRERDAHLHVHNKRVCADGPVFAASEVEI